MGMACWWQQRWVASDVGIGDEGSENSLPSAAGINIAFVA